MKSLNIIPDNDAPYYIFKPPPVYENDNWKVYWDKTIVTDTTITHNRPDITVINKVQKTVRLIDIAIPNNHNIELKHREKIEKYNALKREIRQMWHINDVKIIPVIISTQGLIPKELKKALEEIRIPWESYQKMQHSVILDAANIVRTFLET